MELGEEFNFDTLTIDQLSSLLSTLEASNNQTAIENKILERHGERVFTDTKDKDTPSVDPSSVNMLNQPSSPLQLAQPVSTIQKRKKKAEKKLSDDPIALSLEQKHDILQKECDELVESLQRQKDDSAVLLDNYKAENECYEVSLSELKKEMSEFKRDVMDVLTTALQTTDTPRVHSAPSLLPPNAEKLLRFFEEKTRARDTFIEKTRLKNTTLRLQKHKLKLQLKQKEEMGEVLHAIDFDQLQIENSQFLGKIEERNGDLGKLKLKTGLIQSRLNTLKQILEGVTNEAKNAMIEITQRKGLITKLVNEGVRVEGQTAKAELLNMQLCEQISDYKVIDYVRLQAEQTELQEKVKVLNRKIGIQTLHLKNAEV